MPRLMAFDYGTKRVGIAVSDPLQIIATALTTVHPNKIIGFLENYLSANEVSHFIVGDPLQMDGSPSSSAPHVKGFVNLLRKKFPDVQIELVDERFTSAMAGRAILAAGAKKSDRQKKELVDKVSATLILQGWMESRRF
ncbi:MAG TPA: Holliday junction resolvase RuvX [Anseongella sp.]|nr:Holliday junction resolvase RuvX [Anseongella sp.]